MTERISGLLLATGSTLALATGFAHAAALEQTVPPVVRLLYQEGTYGEIGTTYTDPHQSGEGATLPPPVGAPTFVPGNTGDVFRGRWNFSGAFKGDINDRLSYLLVFDQPYAADTHYGKGSFPASVFTYDGSLADLNTYQFSGLLAYDLEGGFKLYGGLRAQRLDAKAAIPFINGYSVDADPNWGYGYLFGVAYARPEMALRVALTYSSKINHDLDTSEFTATTGTVDTSTSVDTPQSATLEFQTGVAPKTLIFGSVRWVDWSNFAIEPPLYAATTAALLGAPRALVEYQDDWWTYSLGVGRQLTDTLAGSLSITWEPSVGGVMTTLGPYDGRTLGTAALSYDLGKINITGGVTYGVLGNTKNLLATDFNDGWLWGAGLRVGYTF